MFTFAKYLKKMGMPKTIKSRRIFNIISYEESYFDFSRCSSSRVHELLQENLCMQIVCRRYRWSGN